MHQPPQHSLARIRQLWSLLFTALSLAAAGGSTHVYAQTTDNSAAAQNPGTHADQLPPASSELIHGLVLLLLPDTFDDEDDWGREARIQSGLNVDFEDGRLQTSRRWKHVNHGSWKRVSGHLKSPAETLRLQLQRLPEAVDGAARYQLQAAATFRATGRQQQWNYGVMLWSISAEAEFDVALDATLRVQQSAAIVDGRPSLQLVPRVETAAARITRFSLRRISHAKGSAIREFGSWFEGLIQQRVARENQRLPERINRRLEQQQDRFVLPVWFQIPAADAAPTPEAD